MRSIFFKITQNYPKKQISTRDGLIFGVCARSFSHKSSYANFDLCALGRGWLCASRNDSIGLSRGGLCCFDSRGRAVVPSAPFRCVYIGRIWLVSCGSCSAPFDWQGWNFGVERRGRCARCCGRSGRGPPIPITPR